MKNLIILIALILITFETNAAHIVGSKKFNTGSGKTIRSKKGRTPPIPSRLWNRPQFREHIDDQRDDFWMEGNHRPDRTLMRLMKEVMRDGPHKKEYAELWLLKNERKAVAMELALPIIEQANKRLVRAGLKKDRFNLVSPSYKLPKRKLSQKHLDDFDFFYLFSTNCSFCHSFSKQLADLKNVTPLQYEKGKLIHFKGLPRSTFADEKTIQAYAPDKQFPVLVIYDKKGKKVTPLKGPSNKNQIYKSVTNLMAERDK